MIPWPIALLTLFYGVIATCSAAAAWKISVGISRQSLLWPLVWLVFSGGAMIGLPLLKRWGRLSAILTSVFLTLATLATAGLFVRAHQPLAGLLTALATSAPLSAIRYLQRPIVKGYFGMSSQSATRSTHVH